MKRFASLAAVVVSACSWNGMSNPATVDGVTLQMQAKSHTNIIGKRSYLVTLSANGAKVGQLKMTRDGNIAGTYNGKFITANCGLQASSGFTDNEFIRCMAYVDGKPAGELVSQTSASSVTASQSAPM